MAGTADYAYSDIDSNVSVKQLFGYVVHWKGDLDSSFMILTDTETFYGLSEEEKAHIINGGEFVIDHQNKIRNAFDPIFERVFEQHRKYMTVSCCVGWNMNTFGSTPTALDLEVSVKYVEDVILNTPNLKFIIATGPISAELCYRNFNVREMYNCTEEFPLTKYHTPSDSMMRRQTSSKILNTVIRNTKSVRYMYSPPLYRTSEFAAFVEGCLWQVPSLQQFKVVNQPFDISDSRLGIVDNGSCIDFNEFESKMRQSFVDVDECKRLGVPHRDHPTSIMINAARDPYYMNDTCNKYISVSDLQYDDVRNYVYVYGATPSGTPTHITVRDPVFTFWIRPHVLFATSPECWMDLSSGRQLCDEHLNNLRHIISKKCFYRFKERNYAYCGSPFVLSVDTKVDLHDGAWKERSTQFIRCDVKHYSFIDAITGALRKLVPKTHAKQHASSLREHYGQRLDFYQIFKPEKMFGDKYNVQMSQWHRFDLLKWDAVPLIEQVHATHLRGSIDMPPSGNPIVCLPPENADSIEHESMTSSDIPPDIRGSFDIEVSKFGKNWGTALDSPIICICVCVRRHDTRTSKFEAKTCIPVDGYEYFVFMLGTTESTTTDESLRGKEHLFQFRREDDMLRSYFHFYSLLKPRFYASHNGKSYDIPFVLTRAKIIGIKIPSMGFDEHQMTRIVQNQFQSKAFGEKTVTSIEGECGIAQVDTCELFMREKKLDSYQLGFLAQLYVGMTKSDMPYSAIMGHWRKNDHTRRILIDYCIRDAQLPDQLLTQGQWITSAIELSRASGGVSVAAINEKGMQEKVLGATLQVLKKRNYPYIIRTNKHWSKQFNEEIVERWMEKKEYKEKGAFSVNDKDEDVVFVSKDDRAKRRRLENTTIGSFFTKEVRPTDVHQPARSSAAPALTQRQKRARADAAMAKAKNARADNARKADYQGAVVMDVDKGWFYKLPLGCLDFAALYPSIMMAFNMGSNTIVYADELEERSVTPEQCYKIPDFQTTNPRTKKKVDVYFLLPDVEKGLSAAVEEYLVGLRGMAKKEMAKYENEFLEDNVTPNPMYDKDKFNVFNQRQNNLKILANSKYGALGASGVLSDKDIAGSVTAVGRDSIYIVRRLAESEYGGICRGGDTDSVFMEFPGLPEGFYEKKWAEACARTEAENAERPAMFPLAPGMYRITNVEQMEAFADGILAPHINSCFRRPMKIEYEKAMCRAICIAKKRYIYFLCVRGQRPRLAFKGIETVRRDSLPFTRKTMKAAFDILMRMRDDNMTDDEDQELINRLKQQACDHIRTQAKKLANGEVSIEELILSKMRSREYYANEKQEHLTVVRKMEERGLDPTPVGSRVYYVYTHQADGERAITEDKKKSSGEQKGSMIADDPEWVIQNRIPINYLYYLEHKFKDPIIRVMRYFLFDEMTQLALKRKREQYSLMTPDKRRKLGNDYDLSTVTLQELTAETDRYLFGTSEKGTLNRKKLQTRYEHLRGGRVSSAFIDTSNRNSIASYTQVGRSRLEHLKIEYAIDNEYEILRRESQKHNTIKKELQQKLEYCRSCLKIDSTEPVECTSNTCSKFYPRVTLEGSFNHSQQNLEHLMLDMEDLFV